MGKTTIKLLAHAGRLNPEPAHRELDLLLATGEQQTASLLALALQQHGLKASALTGLQAGIRTCDAHLNARIASVDSECMHMHELLESGHTVVVAGFQGASPDGDVTTLRNHRETNGIRSRNKGSRHSARSSRILLF